ncbi:MAG: AMP-binding protein [bacterium]
MEPPYWNPYLETLAQEKLEQIELRYFRALLSYAKEKSPLYREKLKGIQPQDIVQLQDLCQIPLTEKEELRAFQDLEPRPYGGILGVDIQEVTTFRQTSGTTGKPVYVPETYESWQWRVEAWCHILYMAGFRPRHRVFLPFGYNVYVAFWEAHYAAEKLGCEVVPGGALDTKARIQKILELGANAMMCTPTYGLHMAEQAATMGLDPAQLGLERILCAGEPMPEATRARLEKLFQCHVFDHVGGTEPCGWAGMCEQKKGLHIIEPFFLVEILDPQDTSREVEQGETGVAVVTPLGRRSFPVIRFKTNDLVVRGEASCSCGRTSRKIKEVLGRSDDLRKIRGVLFSPKSVEELLRGEFPQIGEYEIVVSRPGSMDQICLRAEPVSEISIHEAQALSSGLSQRLKTATNLTFQVELVPHGSLPRYSLKARRFRDLREHNP